MDKLDEEELFQLAEYYLNKIVKKHKRASNYDYYSLQKFKNLMECMPGVEETKEYEELMTEIDDLIFYGCQCGRRFLKGKQKIARVCELFVIVKYETLGLEEKKPDSLGENIFLSICAFSWVMLMFAP